MANAEQRQAYNDRLLEELQADPGHPRHGSTTAYRAGCRCRPCTDVHASDARDRSYKRDQDRWANADSHQRTVPVAAATGTRT